MDATQTIEEARKRAQQQIHAARLRAERDVARATKQATRALNKGNRTLRQHPGIVGAVAGTAVLGGVAAWLFGRRRNSRRHGD